MECPSCQTVYDGSAKVSEYFAWLAAVWWCTEWYAILFHGSVPFDSTREMRFVYVQCALGREFVCEHRQMGGQLRVACIGVCLCPCAYVCLQTGGTQSGQYAGPPPIM